MYSNLKLGIILCFSRPSGERFAVERCAVAHCVPSNAVPLNAVRAVQLVELCAIPRVWSTNASLWGQWVKVLVVEATLLLALGSVVER